MEYDKDPKYLLLETVNEAGQTYKNLGSTRTGRMGVRLRKGPRLLHVARAICCTVLWNPEYVKLQHNAIRWLMRLKS